MQPVTTEQATVHTATVEVKVLKLGRRQMTLSVFRQLPCEHIIEDESPMPRLRGTPWGIVNYYWEGCGYNYGAHLHVIWERAGRLYRACVGRVFFDGEHREFVGGRVSCCWHAYGDHHGLLWFEEISRCSSRGECAVLPDPPEPELSYIDAWNKLHDQLAALDQLFIAV